MRPAFHCKKEYYSFFYPSYFVCLQFIFIGLTVSFLIDCVVLVLVGDSLFVLTPPIDGVEGVLVVVPVFGFTKELVLDFFVSVG